METTEAFQKCIAIIAIGSDAIQTGRLPMAEAAFRAAIAGIQSCTPEEASSLVPLIHLSQSFLLQKQDRSQEAKELRTQATAQLEAITTQPQSRGFVYLTANMLYKLGDYRRAIPYWEQVIQAAESDADSDEMASALHTLGECFSRIGLKDHAVIPLRAALRILEFCHEDPRRSSVLIILGNALRKSDPGESEVCYKEAADMHSSRLQYEAATFAWGNLGIICSEQGRFDEALEYYQKVLRVRQQSPGAPGVAGTHNNMAMCYMRMGRFAEAQEAVDRAIQLMSSDGPPAYAYSTKGMIYQKSGDHTNAVDWLRKATAERERQASPNLDSMADDLNCEVTSLRELGRADEAVIAQRSLDRVRARISEILPSDPGSGAAKAPLEGAVTIDITHRSGQNHLRNDINFKKLELSLMYDAEEEKAGHLSGVVTVPGSTTLLFYGGDSEALYTALQRRLHGSPLLAGAMVTIRQRNSKREIILPGNAAPVN
jgi:tetratricopeptide (TPR) repeat protein